MAWYYAGTDGQPVGPVSVEELHDRRLKGTLSADTYVIEYTGQPIENWAWKHYREIFPTNLAPVHPPPPPPVPPPAAAHPLFPSALPGGPRHPDLTSPARSGPYDKAKPSNGWCSWGFGLGLASLLLSVACGIGFFLAIVAVFFCIVGLAQVHGHPEQSGQGRAVGGLCLAGFALLISLIFIVWVAVPMIKAHEQTTTEQTSNDSE